MRKIKIFTTAGLSGEIDTNISTLRELKTVFNQKEINHANMQIVVGETRNELTLDEAILPEGDFKIYLMPKSTKSGTIESDLEDLQSTVNYANKQLEEIKTMLRGGAGISAPLAKSIPSYEEQAALRDMQGLMGHSSDESNGWDD